MGKRVFVSFVFHGNMNYDRYPKSVIRAEFPRIYKIVVDRFRDHPHLKGHVQLSGMTLLSLLDVAPSLVKEMKSLADAGQFSFTGTYYSEPVNVCTDGETDFRCAWLGTEIVRRELGEPDGFFPQEQAYHPQLPWIVDRLGLKWVTLMDPRRAVYKPFVLRGLDGTRVTGVPVVRFHDDLVDLCSRAGDDELFVMVGDFEKPPELNALVSTVDILRRQGTDVRFTTIPEYVARFGTAAEEYHRPCSWTDTEESPSFSRWVSDPQDIVVHDATRRAMDAIKGASVLCSIVERGSEADVPLEGLATTLFDDPSAWDIENPAEYPSVEPGYLKRRGRVTLLSRAEHLLLWAVNSDSRGWEPLVEKRRERINSLDNARFICEEVVDNGLALIERRLDLPARRFDRLLLLYNPAGAACRSLELALGSPYAAYDASGAELPTVNSRVRGQVSTLFEVSMPAWGYKVVGLRATSTVAGAAFRPGARVEQQGAAVVVEGDTVVLASGGRSLSVRLEPFLIKETHRGTVVYRDPLQLGPTRARVRDHLYPQLEVHRQLDHSIHMSALFTLVRGELHCGYDFDFTKPTIVAPPGLRTQGDLNWDPRGLIVTVAGRRGCVFYDTPFGTVRHENDEESFVTALRFAGIQADGSGFAVVSRTGAQSFLARASQGTVGIALGTSTIGGPAEPVPCIVRPDTGYVHHFVRWEQEVLFGRYHHELVVAPFEGAWTEAALPARARSLTERLYWREIQAGRSAKGGDLPAEKSLLSIEPAGVVVEGAHPRDDGAWDVRLNEVHGRETDFTLAAGDRTCRGRIAAHGIETASL